MELMEGPLLISFVRIRFLDIQLAHIVCGCQTIDYSLYTAPNKSRVRALLLSLSLYLSAEYTFKHTYRHTITRVQYINISGYETHQIMKWVSSLNGCDWLRPMADNNPKSSEQKKNPTWVCVCVHFTLSIIMYAAVHVLAAYELFSIYYVLSPPF